MSAVDYRERIVATGVEHQLIDVRRPDEYEVSHLTGSVNIPLQQLDERLAEISSELPIALYCRSGNRSGKAAEFLLEMGYADVHNIGGLSDLAAQGLPVEPSKKN